MKIYFERISFVSSPALIRTNFHVVALETDKETANKLYDSHDKQYPIGRIGSGEDIANAVAFLASSEASFITGVNFVADGGAMNANLTAPNVRSFR